MNNSIKYRIRLLTPRSYTLIAGFGFIVFTTIIFFLLSAFIKDSDPGITGLPGTGDNSISISISRETFQGGSLEDVFLVKIFLVSAFFSLGIVISLWGLLGVLWSFVHGK